MKSHIFILIMKMIMYFWYSINFCGTENQYSRYIFHKTLNAVLACMKLHFTWVLIALQKVLRV
jgi:hypothetical protein